MLPLLLTLLFAVAQAIPTIQAKGSKLFTSDGNQFFIKGIAYQLTDDDPLVDTTQCKLDAALMSSIGANSIRVYHVDSDAHHDGCMSIFADAGIYTWIDLDTFNSYILFDGNPPRWNQTMYEAYQRVMDTFHNYDNVAGFFVGNEMLTIGPDSVAAPFIKAAARDMKAYRDQQGYRDIPVGYSAADISALRPNLQNYLACGSNNSERLDFYSLNAYEWCGETSYDVSGYDMLQQNASGYNIPIFFSETGCNTPAPRTFDDQSAILGPEMSDTWSGAIIYEWIEEANNYGLISYGSPANPTAPAASDVVGGYTRAGTPTPISPDFSNLAGHWATLTPSGVSMNAYNPTETPPPCPAFTSGMWEVDGNAPLPTIGETGVEHTTRAKHSTAAKHTTVTNPTIAKTANTATMTGTAAPAESAAAAGTGASTSSAASASQTPSLALGKHDMLSFSLLAWMGVLVLGELLP